MRILCRKSVVFALLHSLNSVATLFSLTQPGKGINRFECVVKVCLRYQLIVGRILSDRA